MASLCADPEEPAPQEADSADADQPPPQEPARPDCQDLLGHFKKCRLSRHPTNVDEVWFPHDHAKELIKEVVWQSGGSETVRWVLHGTPVAGNGVLGVLELGCNVIAVCEDDHDQEHVKKASVEKAVELSLSGKKLHICQLGIVGHTEAPKFGKG